jgi:5'-nucleotidase
MLDTYRTQLSPILDGVIGQATATFPRDGNTERLAEAPLGNLVADALRATYATQLAYITAGGLRAALPSSYVPLTGTPVRPPAAAPWDLVKGDIYELLPFGNMAVTRTVTGTQLWAMLENGFGQLPTASGRFPQISGFKVVYNPAAAAGARVVSVKLLDNTDIPNDATTYTLATIDFVNLGGDGYTMLNDGAGVQQALMPEMLIAYIDDLNTITPATDGRITAQ